jgi:hypothetical protein
VSAPVSRHATTPLAGYRTTKQTHDAANTQPARFKYAGDSSPVFWIQLAAQTAPSAPVDATTVTGWESQRLSAAFGPTITAYPPAAMNAKLGGGMRTAPTWKSFVIPT